MRSSFNSNDITGKFRTDNRDQTTTFPPGLIAAAFECKRKFWYLAKHIYPYDDPTLFDQKMELPKADWLRKDIFLPSGARIQVWIEQERVAVEVKEVPPHLSHYIQVLQIWGELAQWGIGEAEYQLWYNREYFDEVKLLAKYLKTNYEVNPLGFVSIVCSQPDPEFESELHLQLRELHWLMHTEPEQVPSLATNQTQICSHCRFHDFCYI